MKIGQVLTIAVVVLVPACLSPHLLPSAYLATSGVVVQGNVLSKEESIQMLGEDRWRHVLLVRYVYRPVDTGYPEKSAHRVAPSLYDRLHVSSPVRVVYSPWPLLRVLHMEGMGSVLADSTWLSRIPSDADSFRTLVDLTAIGVTIALCVVAWRRKTRGLILAAAFCATTVASAIFPAGFLAFAILFGVWRSSRGQGYGQVLVTSMVFTAVVMYWRIPRPTILPAGPTRTADAVVRQVQVVDHIWSDSESPGQGLRQPFQMADLEFTPEGARDSIHVLDRVDVDSVPGLRDGATVQVLYSAADPRAARIDGGARTYPEKALVYLLGMTFGIAAVLMLVILPPLGLLERMVNRFRGLMPAIPPEVAAQRLAELPPDHPARKALEGVLRERKSAKRPE